MKMTSNIEAQPQGNEDTLKDTQQPIENAIKQPDAISLPMTDKKHFERIGITADSVIDDHLTGKNIEYRFTIGKGKIKVAITYPTIARAETILDNLIVRDTKRSIAKLGESMDTILEDEDINIDRRIDKLVDSIMHSSAIVNRSYLLAIYMTEYTGKDEIKHVVDKDFYTLAQILSRREMYETSILPAVKDVIIEEIARFSSYIRKCFTVDNLINF